FALLPRLLKAVRPDLVVAQFWHIPWPNAEKFLVCPWAKELLDGMLGNDLLGFHTQGDCNNFLESVDRALECRIDRERFAVQRGGRDTTVRPFPISVDPALADEYLGSDWEQRAQALRKKHRLGDRQLIVGVDRVDYTKGIPERLRAVDRLLHKHYGPDDIFVLYRDSVGCVVSSLHDGMNLVAKEFVTARGDDRGVLVLS